MLPIFAKPIFMIWDVNPPFLNLSLKLIFHMLTALLELSTPYAKNASYTQELFNNLGSSKN